MSNKNKHQIKSKASPAQPPAKNQTVIQHASFSGPLPPPQILADYERIKPGFAERIVALAEGEAAHRRARETRALETEIEMGKTQLREIFLGQVLAFVIGMTALVGGIYLAAHGAETAGGFIGTGGVVGLVTAFIQGRKRPG